MKIKLIITLLVIALYGCSADAEGSYKLSIDSVEFKPTSNKGTQANRTINRVYDPVVQRYTETFVMVQRGKTTLDDKTISMTISYPTGGRAEKSYAVHRSNLSGFILLEGKRYNFVSGTLAVQYPGSDNYEFVFSVNAREIDNNIDTKGIYGDIRLTFKEI